jgi:hypothetical protein
MSKHTPGPWSQEREVALKDLGMDPNRLCVEIQRSGITIGYWVPCEWDGRCPDSALIVAAPELLQATTWAIEDWDENAAKGRHGLSVEMIEHLRAAVAKAEGIAP